MILQVPSENKEKEVIEKSSEINVDSVLMLMLEI